MFGEKPRYSTCDKGIIGYDIVYVKMRYPKRKGMTEIKAFKK